MSHSQASSLSVWWILLGTLLIPCLYLPTLATRFDFIDDGNLVYPAPSKSAIEHVQYTWGRIVANYEHLGPFRPVLWVHWQTAANLLGGGAFAWRCVRLFWTMLAAGALLWLLRELHIRPLAALLATALAMWNPFRNEIWTSLTLAEGVAMPYAVLSLVCAIRAHRSARPWMWDVSGFLCVLAALGCKNTFAALVPAQMLLRIAPDGRHLWEGFRQHGRRAGLLATALLVPIVHYIYYKANWHPGQYQTNGASWGYLVQMLEAIKGATSLDFMGFGLALVLIALGVHGWTSSAAASRSGLSRLTVAIGEGLRPVWDQYRGACLAGLLLLVFGIGIYMPIGAVSGRYTMPAVWGADLMIAVLLSTLAGVSVVVWKRIAYGAVVFGLVVVAIANLGKQDRFAARAALLWETLEYVERQAPPGACVGWVSGPDLNVEEGIHFAWHLENRGRGDLHVCLLDEVGQAQKRCELPAVQQAPTWLVTGRTVVPGFGSQRLQDFNLSFWWRKRAYHCYLYATN